MLTSYPPQKYTIEPANVGHVYCVTSINLANFPRPVVLPPVGVSDTSQYRESIDFVDNFAVINTSGLTGDIVLKEGFNCTIQQYDQQFVIQGDIGAGANVTEEYTHEVPQDEEEVQILADGRYLTGGPTCASIVKYINGLSATTVPIVPGGGIQIHAVEGTLTLIIQADPKNLASSCQIPDCTDDL